jgi:hypothetical protein
MSTTPREPLFTDEQLFGDASPLFANDGRDNRIALYFVGLCEAARDKDAELIQQLVDGLQQIADEGHWTPDMHELLNVAAASGFKPSEE